MRLVPALLPLVALVSSGCCSAAAGAAAQGTAGPTTPPAIVPQNAPAGGTGAVGPGAFPPPTTTPPPPLTQAVYLWCAVPTGASCRTAASVLGVEPTAAEGLPEVLFHGVEDLGNDCSGEGVPALQARLGAALGLPQERWHDHGGTELPREHVADIFYAAGCIHCCDEATPAVKISTRIGPPRASLVRVWEIGMPH